MRVKFKAWARPYLDKHQDLVLKKPDFNASFFKNSKLNMEIGIGKGDFIIDMAKKNPEMSFFGIEKNDTVSGISAKKIVDAEISNIRLCVGDASFLISEIPDCSFDYIFLNFSDPWPKKRHEKRRLTYIKNLIQYFRILKKDGKLCFKTDQRDLYDYTLLALAESPFKQIEACDDYLGNDSFDAQSEYEKEFRKENKKIYRIIAKKEHLCH